MTSLPDSPTHRSGRIIDEAGAVHLWTRRGDLIEVELARSLRPPDTEATVAALHEFEREAQLDGAQVRLVAERPDPGHLQVPNAVADALPLTHRRDLFQLRRPLPVEADHPSRARRQITPRPLRPDDGGEISAWVRVNNRAFAEHPDQGAETPESFERSQQEDWFDPADLLVFDDEDHPGDLAGFCWTRMHPATASDPVLGEIFVIGVDPRHLGTGLGNALTLAGLDHLSSRGAPVAMLYVDADNAAARRLYEGLGFAPHRIRRIFSR